VAEVHPTPRPCYTTLPDATPATVEQALLEAATTHGFTAELWTWSGSPW
jgi:hypothetical protein